MGTIGVRCALARTNLWFHLDVPFADDHLHPDFRTDGRDGRSSELLGILPPWNQLTVVGRRIVTRVLRIRGVVRLSARPDYFDLEVRRGKAWPSVLLEVVQIIREETGDLSAMVQPRQNRSDGHVEQWHTSLLRELFD